MGIAPQSHNRDSNPVSHWWSYLFEELGVLILGRSCSYAFFRGIAQFGDVCDCHPDMARVAGIPLENTRFLEEMSEAIHVWLPLRGFNSFRGTEACTIGLTLQHKFAVILRDFTG